jgi:hypothetical protein
MWFAQRKKDKNDLVEVNALRNVRIGFALDVAECIHFDQSKSFLSFSYSTTTWGEPNKNLLFTAPLHTATDR